MGEREQTLGLVPKETQNPESPILATEKTPRMRRVERHVGDLGEFLQDMSSQKTMTLLGVVREVKKRSAGRENLSRTTIKKWMGKFGINFNPRLRSAEAHKEWWRESGNKRRRQEAVGRYWGDPEKKRKMVARTWSPEARNKRIESLKGYWKGQPERRRETGDRMKKANRRRIQEAIRQTFGENPGQELTELRRRGLTYEEIGEKVGINVSTVRRLAKELGVTTVKRGRRLQSHLKGRKEFVQQARKEGLLEHLGEKERRILAARYLNEEPLTLEELGERFHRTRERIRQIEAEAIQKLKLFSKA